MNWETQARLRAHTDDEAVKAFRRFVVQHFGGCYTRASVFADELAFTEFMNAPRKHPEIVERRQGKSA